MWESSSLTMGFSSIDMQSVLAGCAVQCRRLGQCGRLGLRATTESPLRCVGSGRLSPCQVLPSLTGNYDLATV